MRKRASSVAATGISHCRLSDPKSVKRRVLPTFWGRHPPEQRGQIQIDERLVTQRTERHSRQYGLLHSSHRIEVGLKGCREQRSVLIE